MLFFASITVVMYLVANTFIVAHSLMQARLLYSVLQARQKPAVYLNEAVSLNFFPSVTVQLPVYNEKYVVNRLIDSVIALDYPKELIEIQILDDSTDETFDLASERVRSLRKEGVCIVHLRRESRLGFKAGALREGVAIASGEFIAVFDADFLPAKDFLLRTLGYFQDPKVGWVQTRWEHINRNDSIITKIGAMALDIHFRIEQQGRYQEKAFINFNGTGGIWRKSAITDAGGWNDDTLTEDLDLSYRAQLNGWRSIYLDDYCSRGELPVSISAFYNQQFRWNKGGTEVAVKLFKRVLKANITLKNKVFGLFHLSSPFLFASIFVTSLLSVPVSYIRHTYPSYRLWYYFGLLSFISLPIMVISFYASRSSSLDSQSSNVNSEKNFFLELSSFFLFVAFSMAMSFRNMLAVVQGALGKRTPFVRTPKLGNHISNSFVNNAYLGKALDWYTPLELLLAIYFIYSLKSDFIWFDWPLIFMHLLLAAGFSCMVSLTLFQAVQQIRNPKMQP